MSSHVRDTTHFLQIIENLDIPENALLVSGDVEFLYNSIPHDKGPQAIKHVLLKPSTSEWRLNVFVLGMPYFILHRNGFLFQGYDFLQGVAMGTCCALSCANLYLVPVPGRNGNKTSSQMKPYLCIPATL